MSVFFKKTKSAIFSWTLHFYIETHLTEVGKTHLYYELFYFSSIKGIKSRPNTVTCFLYYQLYIADNQAIDTPTLYLLKSLGDRINRHSIIKSFLRHKIWVSTIKRLRFYDIKFALHRSNVCIISIKRLHYIVETDSIPHGKY